MSDGREHGKQADQQTWILGTGLADDVTEDAQISCMSASGFRDRPLSIGEVSELISLTARTIRYYHEIGLVPEPARDDAGNRAYRLEEISRLLWVQRMAAAGLSLKAVREAAEATDDQCVQDLLTELDRNLAAKEDELRQQRAAVAQLRAFGVANGLFVPETATVLHEAGIDARGRQGEELMLLINTFMDPDRGLSGARSQAFIEARPELKAESLRLERRFEALADADVDDPRVEEWAREMAAHNAAVDAAEEEAGVNQEETDSERINERQITLGAQALASAAEQPAAAQLRAMDRYIELSMADCFTEADQPEQEGHG
ncbi:MerR family transcriptional regulator [Streptomyces noursei]|uniref:helix-turn-helix domain-containing protein n=1 Tax=Streptomyces noursei TaxID=1971 RepID=UPI0012FF27B4|nr:MerR family transcriptional regulator [Streptomyces noursei]UWS70162.1 MerR family transcriptional regulator [Streptomyces noursei]